MFINWIIGIVAVLIVVWNGYRFFKPSKKSSCGCEGCSGCAHASECASAQKTDK